MAQIFLSYSHSDSDFVELIEPRIVRIFGEGVLWYDRKPDGLKGGQWWWSEILREIQYCQIFLFLLSDESAESKWCKKELEEAASLHKTIIPVLLESYSSKDYPKHYSELTQHRLEETHYVDLRSRDRCKCTDLSPLWGAINRAQRPSLSPVERWLLWNQYKILTLLQKGRKNPESFDGTMRILSHGYGLESEWLSTQMDPGLNTNECKEVHDILYMYEMICRTCKDSGCAEIDAPFLRFGGFNHNSEPELYDYMMFLLFHENKYEEIIPENKIYLRGMGREMLPIYRKMLPKWRKRKDKFSLSVEEIKHILYAAQ